MSCSIYPGVLPWITDRVYDRLVDSKIGTMSEFCRLSDDQILFRTGLEFDEIEKTRRFFMGRVKHVFIGIKICSNWVFTPWIEITTSQLLRGSELIKAEVGKCQIITTGAEQIDEFLSPGILIGESLNISSIDGGKWGELNYFCERLLNRTLC